MTTILKRFRETKHEDKEQGKIQHETPHSKNKNYRTTSGTPAFKIRSHFSVDNFLPLIPARLILCHPNKATLWWHISASQITR